MFLDFLRASGCLHYVIEPNTSLLPLEGASDAKVPSEDALAQALRVFSSLRAFLNSMQTHLLSLEFVGRDPLITPLSSALGKRTPRLFEFVSCVCISFS